MPQAVPSGWDPLSAHTELPVAQEIVPVLQRLAGWQEPPEEQVTQLPLLQTLPVPQAVPSGWDPLSAHTELPVAQEIVPVLQRLAGWQEVPEEHAMQLPLTQTFPVPQVVKSATGVQVPVAQELHWPHALSQQILLTQFPFLHWLLAEQLPPLSFLGAQVPEAQ